jgi:hypothetical protein
MLVFDEGNIDNSEDPSLASSSNESDNEGDDIPLHAPTNEDTWTDEFGYPFLYSDAMDMYMRQQDNIRRSDPGEKKVEGVDWIPDNMQCYIDLLYHLKRHRVDKKLFDVVVNWARHWTAKNPDIFKSTTDGWKRKTVIERVSKLFDKTGLRPVDTLVNLSDGRVVSVPVVDFEECICDLLSDPEINHPSNLSKGLDRQTWRPITSIAEHERDQDAILGEKDSGYLYRLGMNLHCPLRSEVDPKMVRPLPLIFNIDKSHSDLHGSLAVTPVTVSLAMLDCRTQQKVRAWRVMATVPNLSAKKGKNKKRSVSDGLATANDIHKVMKAAFSSFKKYYDMGGILWEDNNGNVLTLKPYIHCIIGDTAGNNELVGHYQGCFARLQLKDCKCTEDQLTMCPPVCKPISFFNMMGVGGDAKEIFRLYDENNLISLMELSMVGRDKSKKRVVQKYFSKHAVENAFYDLPLSDPYQGIVGVTPQELLHVIESGIVGYSLQSISDIIGRRSINASCKELVDKLFYDIKDCMDRNSERDVCRMSNRRGFFDLTNIGAEERFGNFFGLIVLMHTTYGERLMSDHFDREEVDFDKTRETCMLLVSWTRFVMDFNKRRDVRDGINATIMMQERIMRDLPRDKREKTELESGSHGWNITKFHCLPHLVSNILKFGCGRVTHGSAGEKNHKRFAKDAGKGTQRRVDSYATQVGQNNYEFDVIDSAYGKIRRRCVPTDLFNNYKSKEIVSRYKDRVEENVTVKVERGRFTLKVVVDGRGQITWKHSWWDKRKNGLVEHNPHKLLIYAVGCNAGDYRKIFGLSSETTFEVECFTEANVNGVLYRSTPHYLGRSWYDWGLFEFPETKDSGGNIMCAAQMLGFFKYNKSEEALTYKKIEMEGKSYDECMGVADEETYVALRCQSKYMHYSHLEKHMIRRFSMEDDVRLYILPLTQLRGPLLVVPDVLEEGRVSKSNYIAIAAKSMWGNYFRYYIEREVRQTGAMNSVADGDKDDGDGARKSGGESGDDGSEESSWVEEYDEDDW